MKKILHVVGRMHYGGMETLIMNLYRHIDKEKIQFDILAYYAKPGEYDEEVRQLGGNVYVVERTLNPIKYLYKLGVFFSKHHDYAAVHVHILWLAWIYFLYADKYGIKKLSHIHSDKILHKGIFLAIWRMFEKISIKKSDTIFACSKKAALYHGSDKKKTYLLKNGIDGKRFYYNESVRKEVRAEFRLEQKKVVVCTARFTTPKNHKFLINIIDEMVKRDKSVFLLLIGEGPLEAFIRQTVEKLGLVSYVKFMGVRNDVNRILQGADAYVMPSLYEGLGIAYIEAQSAGMKTFASDEAYKEEAHISDLFLHRPLTDGAQVWAEWILQNIVYERISKQEELLKSGFEIDKTAYLLQYFYMGEANATELFELI